MAPYDIGHQRGMALFVKNVTGDDQIEHAQRRQLAIPAHMPVMHGRQRIQCGVVGEKWFGQRVNVGGDDIAASLQQHKTGQSDAATQFEDALAFNVKAAHGLGKQTA
ncbi:hypothetical protein D3C81_878140 [compost metagenome]